MKFFAVLLITLFTSTSVIANDSGAWYDPEQDGHGISLFEWNDGVVFWWFTHNNENQLWLMSSVEEPALDMTFDLYAPSASTFPTAEDVDVGEPVGVASLSNNLDGTWDFSWEIVSPVITCSDVYGFVPPGPLDPLCRGEEGKYNPDGVIDEGLGLEDEKGSATFKRLTPQ